MAAILSAKRKEVRFPYLLHAHYLTIVYVLSQRTLEGRTDYLMNQLLAIGIGDRPIIFLAHSMGGLLVKNILVTGKRSILKLQLQLQLQ